jgi:UDP-N-acetyl-2-amino-2-deoxyglucuronate dehydrogenase
MPRTWRYAIVGTGVVGELHIRSLASVPECQLVAVCDLETFKGKSALDKNKITVPIYTDLKEMLTREKLDSVHICTPSGDHMNPTITAMQHGVNVIVEKPMEILPDRIDAMYAASKKHNVKLAGIFQNRWNDANRVIHHAVQQNRFGRVSWVGVFTPWYRTDEYYADGGWRGTCKLDGGGAVMNQGVHQVDIMQWVAGPVKTLSAFMASRIHAEIEVEDTLTCALQFESGAFGTYVSTTAMYPGGHTRLEVGGEFGMAVMENGLTRFEFKNPRPEDAQLLAALNPASAKDAGGGRSATDIGLNLHAQNIVAIYSAWERNEEAETYAPEARKAVAIIQAMYESARNGGKPVEVK